MNLYSHRWAAAALLSLSMAAAQADSFTSSATSLASQSVGSLSDSLTGSSGSSSKDNKTAEGSYRIERVAELADRPTHVRLHLQGAAGEAQLVLPRQAVQTQGLGVNAVIELRQRAFGMEVAKAATREPFFLLLADGWTHDLHTRAVRL